VSIMFTISWKITLVVLSLSPVCLLVIRIQVLRALIEPS
jgi:ABC-type multidrug transport system fused ATPase/permease subunit